jgi:hypothetical protein
VYHDTLLLYKLKGTSRKYTANFFPTLPSFIWSPYLHLPGLPLPTRPTFIYRVCLYLHELRVVHIRPSYTYPVYCRCIHLAYTCNHPAYLYLPCLLIPTLTFLFTRPTCTLGLLVSILDLLVPTPPTCTYPAFTCMYLPGLLVPTLQLSCDFLALYLHIFIFTCIQCLSHNLLYQPGLLVITHLTVKYVFGPFYL